MNQNCYAMHKLSFSTGDMYIIRKCLVAYLELATVIWIVNCVL